ncbi:MAG: aminoacyl-histidine dipeptidase [Candidatus Cryptobacteroides sp.]
MTIKDLTPSVVWDNFYKISRIPRPSKHEEKIREYLLNWGKEHNLETFEDKTGNVIIRVPATPGYENRKGVVLQGHMDMVPQKNSDKVHDFLTDPIETKVEGDWLKACGTTLGADNGLGVALALAVAESKEVEHGPIEILVTYDEETGMTGAQALESGVLKGEILINLDSETEGELYVGCAGGIDASASGTYTLVEKAEGYKAFDFSVKGCQGGHSGMDIILYRANASKIATRILLPLLENEDVKLINLEGGTLRNAIARECFAQLYVKDEEKTRTFIDTQAEKILKEYAITDPDMKISLESCDCDKAYVEDKDALKILRAVLACPDGVERMSSSIEGLVETSNNMAIVKVSDGAYEVKSLLRSSVDSAKEALCEKMKAVFELAGAKIEFTGGYSGWAPNPDSDILKVMKEVYHRLYGSEPKVMAIHAGLECGILSGAYPNWDMISCGPTLLSPHSPDERAYIPSVAKVWEYLQEVLKSIPECK